jgi:ribosomal protein S12 methylthiotransferase accessory factor
MAIAQQTISDFNLCVKSEAFGSEIQSYRCKLIDNKARKIFYGFGKGLGLQSKASAYFEALEHVAVHFFAQAMANNKNNYFPHESFDQKIPGVFLTEITNNQQLFYPLYLLDPRYAKHPSHFDHLDYTSHAWRANDSGIASGANITEASIHALNEIVERDAHSLFLIEGFLKNKQQNIRRISHDSIPPKLKTIINQIENQFSEKLSIFDITTDIDIPVIYVSMTQQKSLIQASGCGASLCREIALERALLEALQPVHVRNDKLVDNQQQIIDQLSDTPLLLKCAIADVRNLKAETIDFQSLPNYNVNQTLDEQLALIISKIKKLGFNIYKKIICEHEKGFSCVKYYIPGLEQFHIVQTGKRVLPNNRGIQLIKNEKEYCITQS